MRWFPLTPNCAFRPWRRDFLRPRDHRISLIVSKRRAAVFISSEASVKSRKLLQLKKSKPRVLQVSRFSALIFSNCEILCNLTDVPASIYDRKRAGRRFDTIHDILRSLRLAQSLLKSPFLYAINH